MQKDSIARCGVLIAIVIAIIGCFSPSVRQAAVHGEQMVKDTYGTILDTFSGDIFDATTSFKLAGTTFFSSAGLVNNTLTEKVTTGSCTTASSTIFAVQNPFSATSTLTFAEIYGTEGATSTDILVATSTTPSPAIPVTATSTLGANILNLAQVTNATQFFSAAGVIAGSSKGYTNPKGIPSSISNAASVVGPSEYVIGFSTSTVTANNGGTSASGVGVPASCTYKFKWLSQ